MKSNQLDVVTVFAPREGHWQKYLPLLELQEKSVAKFAGHRHVVVTDGVPEAIKHLNLFSTELPVNLMLMILAGQIAYLQQWSGDYPVVMLDVDCLVARNLHEAFTGNFDIGLTRRVNAVSPINNGAMYIASGAREKALEFFNRAYQLCGLHWGGDQEAISHAAAPVPNVECIENRSGTRLAFFSMKTHNIIPEVEGAFHKRRPFIVHFKGEKKKPWMKTYFTKWME